MLHQLTITQAHAKLKAKEISAVELMQACLERIEAVDGALNAVVYKDAERAVKQAEEIDTAGDFTSPLAGIPYLTKDVFCEEGVPTTACSNMLREKDYVPPFTATTSARLMDKGAISMGKSNTDEFTMGGSTETSCYGTSHNPWDTQRTTGGSSGGSAAAVAADECIFAIGTDTGGSIRQPAGYCGCVGMRTTYGRTSRYGAMSMASSLDTTGALTKSVDDLALVLQAIAGKDTHDGTTADVPVPGFADALKKDVKGLKIGLPKEYFVEGIDPEVDAAVRKAAEELEAQGAKLEEVSLPHTEHAIGTYYVTISSEISSNMARFDGIRFGYTNKDAADLIDYYFKVRSEGFGDEVKRRIMLGTFALSAGYYDAYYRQAQKVRRLIQRDFEEAFKKVDVLLSPVAPTPAFKIGAHANDPVAMYLEDAFTVSQALAGIPCLSVPCGFSKGNLPIGLQIMGPQWGEEVVLQTGAAYERETKWSDMKPNL